MLFLVVKVCQESVSSTKKGAPDSKFDKTWGYEIVGGYYSSEAKMEV